MKRTKIILILLLLATVAQARTRKVLFLGNSYIHTNGIPGMLQQLALSMGDTLIYEEYSPGGWTMQQHAGDPSALAKIKAQKWDVVILQEQSLMPAREQSYVEIGVYPFAKKLDSLVTDNYACSESMFYMTWGRKNGEASYCTVDTGFCTYDRMQHRLRYSYMKMAKDNKATVAPVGAAWKLVRDSAASIELYNADESHPSQAGSYLAACVFYASIFHKSPVGSSYNAGIVKADADKLQYYSAKVVLDSLGQWQQYGNYTKAGFTYAVAGNKTTFQNSSTFATSYKWEFGDGNTSTQASPVHTYAQQGKYTVKFTAGNNCFSETITDTVKIGAGSAGNIAGKNEKISIATAGNGSVILFLPDTGNYKELQVYSISGSLIMTLDAAHTKQLTLNNLVPGMYVYKLNGENNTTGHFNVQ